MHQSIRARDRLCRIFQAWACLLAFGAAVPAATAQHSHAGQHGTAASGKALELGASAAFDAQGTLWVVSKENRPSEGADASKGAAGASFLALRRSTDMGRTWSEPVQAASEPVAARGEERPKIAFGPKGELYIVYTRPAAGSRNPHIGDIRFIRSLDGGKTFSEPLTVHADRSPIVHSFGSLILDAKGNLYVVWIDSRDKEKDKEKSKEKEKKKAGEQAGSQARAGQPQQAAYAGNAIYYAVSSDGGRSFKGDYKIAEHTCECCRIGLALAPDGQPAAMWRHIFSPNVRDHALAALRPDGRAGKPIRTTFDDWQVDACPHHGPSLAYAPDGTRHQVWFNGREDERGGVHYARADAKGSLGKPMALGSPQAAHADIAIRGRQLAVVWKQFDGRATAILGKISQDGGLSWADRTFADTAGDSSKPYLIESPLGLALLWHTQNEGIRIIPVPGAP